MTAAFDPFEDISGRKTTLAVNDELRLYWLCNQVRSSRPLTADQGVFPSLGRVVFTENTKNLTMPELPLKM